jgi:ubiquinone/menaquinone biosynthesis C-methylase UbiE
MKKHEISPDEVARLWDANAAHWAGDVRAGWDAYREHYNNPAFLEFVGALTDQTVLDAGCGEGYNTRIFARRGARMTGVDISPRMIELARKEERRHPIGIRYEVASYTALAVFADACFDAVVSTMALMDGPDFPAAMRQFHRVLKTGGMLAFSILHPCFVTKGFDWLQDKQGKLRLSVGDYFNDGAWVETWRFSSAREHVADATPFAVPRFDRTLSYYINSVIEAGFVLQRIAEPQPTEEACTRHPNLRAWRDNAPTFLYVMALKPGT